MQEMAAKTWPAGRVGETARIGGRPPFEIFFNQTTPTLCHNINPRNKSDPGGGGDQSAEYGHLTQPSDKYVQLWEPPPP
jgi:hypothetical protein